MISKEQVDQLGTWARWVDQPAFIKAFGPSLGQHLWDKWTIKHNRDFLSFWNYLDGETAQLIIDQVNKGEK